MTKAETIMEKLAVSFDEEDFKHLVLRGRQRYKLAVTKDNVHDWNMKIQNGNAVHLGVNPKDMDTHIYAVKHGGQDLLVAYKNKHKTVKTFWDPPTAFGEALLNAIRKK